MKPNSWSLKYCPSSHKRKLQFGSEAAANRFIEYNADEIKNSKGYAPIRAYYCNACCCWHTTSKHNRPMLPPPMEEDDNGTVLFREGDRHGTIFISQSNNSNPTSMSQSKTTVSRQAQLQNMRNMRADQKNAIRKLIEEFNGEHAQRNAQVQQWAKDHPTMELEAEFQLESLRQLHDRYVAHVYAMPLTPDEQPAHRTLGYRMIETHMDELRNIQHQLEQEESERMRRAEEERKAKEAEELRQQQEAERLAELARLDRERKAEEARKAAEAKKAKRPRISKTPVPDGSDVSSNSVTTPSPSTPEEVIFDIPDVNPDPHALSALTDETIHVRLDLLSNGTEDGILTLPEPLASKVLAKGYDSVNLGRTKGGGDLCLAFGSGFPIPLDIDDQYFIIHSQPYAKTIFKHFQESKHTDHRLYRYTLGIQPKMMYIKLQSL